MTEGQLDFSDDSAEWSRWSIRRQLRHIAYVFFFYLGKLWGESLFPGRPILAAIDIDRAIREGRQLDPKRFQSPSAVLAKIGEAIAVVEEILGRESVEGLRRKSISRRVPKTMTWENGESVAAFWETMERLHPDGVRRDPKEPDTWWITLEASLREVYWEALTHLNTIQRLKRAQGLPTLAPVPKVGFLTRSEFSGEAIP